MSDIETAKRVADSLESKDLERLQDLLADDFVAKSPTMGLSKQQTFAFLQILFTAFPDYSFGLTDFREKGDLIYCCTSHEKGTHKGVLDLNPLGMPVLVPSTGKSFKLPESTYTFRVANDKVTSFIEEYGEDGGLGGILKQLGVKLA